MAEWQPIKSAKKDGTWVLLRGRNSIGQPMIPVVAAWRAGEGKNLDVTWRDSANLRDVSSVINDGCPGIPADWMPLPTSPGDSTDLRLMSASIARDDDHPQAQSSPDTTKLLEENAELKRKLSRAERDICEVRAELDATLAYIKTEAPGAIKEPTT